MGYSIQDKILYFQKRVRDKKLSKGQRIYAYGKLRQLKYDEFKIFKVKSKYLFNASVNDDHYVMTIKNDGRDNFIITPIFTHKGTKKEVLKKHNCLEVSGMPNARFNKKSHIYARLRAKKYHDNTNIKKDILHESAYQIDLLQVPEIENFLYDNSNSSIAKENRDLKNRWRLRRLRR